MRSDFGPGRTFPDFVLPDGTNTEHQLSALQGDDPMLVVLIRSLLCPKDREQLASLARVHALLDAGCCKLVAITADASPAEAEEVAALNVLLHDQAQRVRDTLDIAVLTDDGDEPPLIPHTFLLAPGLSIRKVWNGRHPWGRPSSCDLHDALCELTRELRREVDRPRANVGGNSLDQTLNDMVASSRDSGRFAARRSTS
jgi:peroxiredoxin